MPRTKTNRSKPKSIRQRTVSMRAFLRGFAQEILPKSTLGRKILAFIVALAVITVGITYGISRWYVYQHRDEPLVIGATFIADYARYFELNPKETLQASIDELEITDYRLVSYWENHEPRPDQYDFSELDWQFDMVEEAGGTVSLAIGLRQPRWPECHGPEWAMSQPQSVWEEELKEYMAVVINRYKDRDVLISYQLENEYFLDVFGHCPDHSRERLTDEYNFVKSIDDSRPLIVSRSNNATPSWPMNEPRADKIGASIYKRVWDGTVTKRYFEYPLPPWFYSFLAGGAELTTGRNTFIHELQTEAWPPKGVDIRTAPIDELYKSFTPQRLERMLHYGKDTGMKRMDVWGIEWWYQLKTKRGEPAMWETAKETIAEIREEQ